MFSNVSHIVIRAQLMKSIKSDIYSFYLPNKKHFIAMKYNFYVFRKAAWAKSKMNYLVESKRKF